MGYFENIEKIFMDDIREKKRTGNGAFHRTGKGVKHHMSGIKTPYDFMKAKEKRKLNGEVRVFNMYETILTRDEFDLKDTETQRNMMVRWREIYSNEDIMKAMGINGSGSFHKIIKELGVPKKTRWDKTGKDRKRSAKKTIAIAEAPVIQEPVKHEPVKQDLLSNGMHLEYNGEFSSDQLSKIFTKLQLLTDGEENKFLLSISLTERT